MDFVISAFKVSLCVVFQFNLDVIQGDIPSVGTCYSFLLQYQECPSVDLPWFSFAVSGVSFSVCEVYECRHLNR